MHTGHLVLVEADSAEEATSIVEGNLMPDEGSSWADWSDWSQIGGRYEGVFGEVEGNSTPNALCYGDDPIFADTKIDHFLKFRMEYFERSKKDLEGFDFHSVLDNYSPEAGNSFDENRMKTWIAIGALRTADDYWTSNSYVYDMTYGSASLSDFRRRCDENPDKQFLVMVDLHF